MYRRAMVETARGRRQADAAFKRPATTSASLSLSLKAATLLTLATVSAVNAASSAAIISPLPGAGALEVAPLEAEPGPPPVPDARGRLWFAGRGPAVAEGVLGTTEDANADSTADVVAAAETPAGPGIWHRAADTVPWEWTALASELVTRSIYDGADAPPSPSWPSDVIHLQAQEVVRPDGDTLGYWVWNPSVFVGGASGIGGSGSHFWSPRWQWASSGEPLLLTP
jgi:hypothetical protein